MKARITQLKAPWPSGALVGAIVAFVAGEIPAWAVGKCVPAGEDEEAEYVIEPVQPVVERAAPIADPLAELRSQAEAHFERLTAEHAAELAELQAKLDAANAEREALAAELAAARAEFVSGSIGEEANGKALDKAALKAEAKALGLEFDGRMPAAELAELIAAKKAEQQ